MGETQFECRWTVPWVTVSPELGKRNEGEDEMNISIYP